ncbi:MAG: molybdate ABC transporter substrate-binding protein [Pontixanthobacter sp.]
MPATVVPSLVAMISGKFLTNWMLALAALILLHGCAPGGPNGPVIFAASSLQKPLEAFAEEWAAAGNDPPVFSFASSAALARQIENGSPADIFISANAQWTEYIVTVGRLSDSAVRPVASNTLVLARSIRERSLGQTGQEAGMDALNEARSIATGDPATVPLGRYAEEALKNLGVWERAASRIVPAASSAAALKLVLLGEADLGILYASDARSRDDLGVIYNFPETAHAPIVYNAVILPSSAHPAAGNFLAALGDERARAIFAAHGFGRP